MPTAPSCHDFSSAVGTHFCAHCLHGREGVHPEKVELGNLPPQKNLMCSVSLQVAYFLQWQNAHKRNHFRHRRGYQKLTKIDPSFVGKILPEELIKFLTAGCLNLEVDLSCSYV